ncbi:MAG: L28 family ribosomal protein [bacterium]|nr:L28 family ribosomal protein [bacterium]
MSKQCAICGKTSMMVWKLKKLRGKYNPTVKTRKYPNLQWVRLTSNLPAGKAGQRIKACTKCIKAMAKR